MCIAGNLVTSIFRPLPQWVVLLIWLSELGICLFAQIYRYRRVSGPVQRQQTKWVVFGFAMPFVLILGLVVAGALFPSLDRPGLPGLIYGLTGRLFSYLLFLPIPLSLGIAILRYRLWDIDLIINRALVYGTLSAGVAGIYVLVVGALGTLFQASGNLAISLIATALVALLFQPLRERLQRGANRLIYGERDDPYAVLSRLGQRLDATLAPAAALPTIVETVVQALKLPYVAIALVEDDRRPTIDDTAASATVHRPSSIVAATGTSAVIRAREAGLGEQRS